MAFNCATTNVIMTVKFIEKCVCLTESTSVNNTVNSSSKRDVEKERGEIFSARVHMRVSNTANNIISDSSLSNNVGLCIPKCRQLVRNWL